MTKPLHYSTILLFILVSLLVWACGCKQPTSQPPKSNYNPSVCLFNIWFDSVQNMQVSGLHIYGMVRDTTRVYFPANGRIIITNIRTHKVTILQGDTTRIHDTIYIPKNIRNDMPDQAQWRDRNGKKWWVKFDSLPLTTKPTPIGKGSHILKNGSIVFSFDTKCGVATWVLDSLNRASSIFDEVDSTPCPYRIIKGPINREYFRKTFLDSLIIENN